MFNLNLFLQSGGFILRTKRFLVISFILIITLLTINSMIYSATGYDSYLYDFFENIRPAPLPYRVVETVDNNRLKGQLEEPLARLRDFFVADGKIYVLDGDTARLIVFNQDWGIEQEIREFVNNGQTDSFDDPRGVFVTADGRIYIADRGNRRIVVLEADGSFVRTYDGPDIAGELIPEGFSFRVNQLVVSPLGRIVTIVDGVYDGLMDFDMEGNFHGFIGAPEVGVRVEDYIWRRIATEEQRQRMIRYVPTEFNNMTIDERGFIYAVEAGSVQEETIKKLNPSGEELLSRGNIHPPVGDLFELDLHEEDRVQRFIDITVRENGIFSVLERARGRIFSYDNEGNLLYIFGQRGVGKGSLNNPLAIESYGHYILVLEGNPPRITVFEPTAYSQNIHQAMDDYIAGRYQQSADRWHQVLKQNLHFELAYTGIGRQHLRQDNFTQAMQMFRLGQNRPQYSQAFTYYRRDTIIENFSTILLLFVMIIIALMLYVKLSARLDVAKIDKFISTTAKEGRLRYLKYILAKLINLVKNAANAFYVIFHPFGGFWDLKHENKGKLHFAVILLSLVCISYVFLRQYTAFIFNPRDIQDLNIYLEFASVLIPFGLWCVINWAFTTLTDGKGTVKDIFIASAYALTPIILINIPLTVISHYLTLDEELFYNLLLVVSVIWSMGLLFFGTMVIHEYDISKNIVSTAVTLVGMGSVLFLALLYVAVVGRFIGFVYSVVNEVVLRS